MKQTKDRPAERKLLVDIDGLAAMLSCGEYTAKQIGELAEARITIGRRVLYSVSKIEEYLVKTAM